MELHDTENAAQFDTKVECQAWIDSRVVRFKLRMVNVTRPGAATTYDAQKFDGKIHNTRAEDFKESGTDEPLKLYAAPTKQGEVWMAAMVVQES